MKFSFTTIALLALSSHTNAEKKWSTTSYEIWGSDQSNTVEGQSALGVAGSYIWIWDSNDVQAEIISQQEAGSHSPVPKPCSPNDTAGPCELFTIFPKTLTDNASGETLENVISFGRWHGVTKDPQNRYVTANIFAPNGGYLGIVDTTSKEAVALFRVTEMSYEKGEGKATARSVHMSFWNGDGSAILIHNLHGKAIERINVERDDMGVITSVSFDKSATVGIGKSMEVVNEASFFHGTNAFGNPLLGALTGSYDNADLGDVTPAGTCKEDGCGGGTDAGRPNNVPICPVVANDNGLVFNTLGGGGLFVLDSTKTPMTIVGAYGNNKVYGAGVCGTQVSDRVYVTSGTSASGAGATQSLFALYAFDPSLYTTGSEYEENIPEPTLVFDDETGTATGGKTTGEVINISGQIQGETTRRDAHDVAGTLDQKYVHVVDRIQNVVEVFDSETDEAVGSYDLTTATGTKGDGSSGPCEAASVTDGGDGFPINDPAPDFIDATPDGNYMVLSFRGPAPVSAGHAAQGSCPGVGIVELLEGGKTGKLVAVMRSTNTIGDIVDEISPAGGSTYIGKERADVHDTVVVFHSEEEEKSSANTVSLVSAYLMSVAASLFVLIIK